MAIVNALDLSTAHLQESTNEQLEKFADKLVSPIPFRYVAHEYGFILFIPEIQGDLPTLDALTRLGMQEIYPIIRYALKNKCTLINLDRDAEVMDEFAHFNW